MKKTRFTKVIAFAMMLVIMISCCSCGNTATNPEAELLESCKNAVNDSIPSDYAPIDVAYEGNDIYAITFLGYTQKCQFSGSPSPLDTSQFITSEVTNEKVLKIVETSKEKVANYITNSTIFSNKEELIENMKCIPVYNMHNSSEFDVEGSAAFYYDNVLYICEEEFVCEWMICHELLHYVKNLTYTQPHPAWYVGNFDEAMTDIIVSFMDADISKDCVSSYSIFYPYVEVYIGIFQEDALHDFFYGYEDGTGVLSVATTYEHQAFIYMFNHIFENPTFEPMMTSLMLMWHDILTN